MGDFPCTLTPGQMRNFWSACAKGQNKRALAFLRLGADPAYQGPCGRMPLHAACEEGNSELVHALAQAGAPLDAPDPAGDTPLILAIRSGSLDCAMLLAKAGASLEKRGASKLAPAACAALGGQIEIFAELLRAGCEPAPEGPPGRSLWTGLAKMPDCDLALRCARLIVQIRPAALANLGPGGDAPLHEAFRESSWRFGQGLAQLGADWALQNLRGENALHIAFSKLSCPQDLAAELAGKSHLLHVPDMDGMLPIHRAALFGRREYAFLLAKSGSPADLPDRSGLTPLLALSSGGAPPAELAEFESLLLGQGIGQARTASLAPKRNSL